MDERARRLARGDPSAFAELYDDCADRLHRYLSARLGSRSDADDVLQETFVRLARTRSALAPVEDLVAYLFAMARNEAIRWMERRDREGRAREARSGRAPAEPTSDDPSLDVEAAEWVAATMARLGPELREVVELRIHGDLTFREIAEVTGLPQGTVATRYRTALEKLRGQMVEDRG
jgi:RNA polymerase sigma-70 factor (ECF subfamily)